MLGAGEENLSLSHIFLGSCLQVREKGTGKLIGTFGQRSKQMKAYTITAIQDDKVESKCTHQTSRTHLKSEMS